jgi:uncharacterized protein YaiL (DUF2058 family)
MDDLKSIVEYHEQALRSIEDQLGRLVENQDRHRREAREEMATLRRLQDKNDRFLARAFRLGVVAVRRERVRRLEDDKRLEAKQATDRAAWEERMERIERNIDRFLNGLPGRNGGNGAASPN